MTTVKNCSSTDHQRTIDNDLTMVINPIQTGRFGNFVRLGGGLNVPALFVCLYLSNF